MELSGHPTQDLIDELVERGAIPITGDSRGPSLADAGELAPGPGNWLWIPDAVFDTGFDDVT